jgi:DNA-binding LacI/PurR family transcriptional regulator
VRTAESADECVHLLLHDGQTERPDTLIIDNDNLLEPAVRGLTAAGARVPEDVEIVSHANYPLLHQEPLPVPVTRLGFDMRRILDACFNSLRAQRSGEGPVSPTIGAVFESEIVG